MPKILLVEDDEQLAELITAGLTSQNFVVEHLTDGAEGLHRLKYFHFDVAILDWALPGMPGVEVCKEFRKSGGTIPVLMLTGKQALHDKEEAFDIGADDYLTKPFAFRELSARIRALLRRPHAIQKPIIDLGLITMDLSGRIVTISGAPIEIRPAEFSVLELFMKSPGRVFTTEELLTKLFHSESEASDEAVRQRIFRLRKTLGKHESLIKTVAGVGYKLEA
jgi:DNA-binding response OmpR family regulator